MSGDDLDISIDAMNIHLRDHPRKNTKVDWIIFLRTREMYRGACEMRKINEKLKKIQEEQEVEKVRLLPFYESWKQFFAWGWKNKEERAREKENAKQ